MSRNITINAVDLFCGAGGLTRGLIEAGLHVRMGVDIDPACRYPYTSNNNVEFSLQTVEGLKPADLSKHLGFNGFSLLAGCAPCQTFSTYNRKATESDRRWWLLICFLRLVTELRPDFVTMENVPRLMDQNVFTKFVTGLKNSGYFVSYEVVNCADYGLPQNRNRLVLLASRLGSISLLQPSDVNATPTTVRDALNTLPTLVSGTCHINDPLHTCATLSELNLKRIRASKPGGSWRDWPDHLVAACHKKQSGKTYPSVYGRMKWEQPSPTLTTQFFGFGNGRFGHPEQDRAISFREAAILQSFPADYCFTPPGHNLQHKKLGRLIGNAVPVTLGTVIGKSFMQHASAYKKSIKWKVK